jgi:hypothetical protein
VTESAEWVAGQGTIGPDQVTVKAMSARSILNGRYGQGSNGASGVRTGHSTQIIKVDLERLT